QGGHRVVGRDVGEDRGVDVPSSCSSRGREDLTHGDQVARVDQACEHRLLQGHARCTDAEAALRCDVLHEVGGPRLGGRVSRIGANTDPDAEEPVAVDDVVAATTLEGVTAGTADQDVALAPGRAA